MSAKSEPEKTPKPADLEAIEARASAATPGPWTSPWIGDSTCRDAILGGGGEVVGVTWRDGWHLAVTQADAEFIAAARTDVPALVAELRQLRAELAGQHRPGAYPAPILVPLRTTTGLNAREHPMARAKRVKSERDAVSRALRKALGAPRHRCSGVVTLPCVVVLTRVGPRADLADSDGTSGGLKAVRDAVAAYLGVDDGSDWLRWEYAQERGEWGVRVEFRAAQPFDAPPPGV